VDWPFNFELPTREGELKMVMDMNAMRISSIQNYLLVALIFEVLTFVAAAWGLYGTVGGILAVSSASVPPIGAYFALGGLVFGLVYLLLAVVLTIPVTMRTNRMRSAAYAGDFAALKKLSSTGWAVVALIFSLVIPGIMLLIADGSIRRP
jgi:putative membrane protein